MVTATTRWKMFNSKFIFHRIYTSLDHMHHYYSDDFFSRQIKFDINRSYLRREDREIMDGVQSIK